MKLGYKSLIQIRKENVISVLVVKGKEGDLNSKL